MIVCSLYYLILHYLMPYFCSSSFLIWFFRFKEDHARLPCHVFKVTSIVNLSNAARPYSFCSVLCSCVPFLLSHFILQRNIYICLFHSSSTSIMLDCQTSLLNRVGGQPEGGMWLGPHNLFCQSTSLTTLISNEWFRAS